jgi:hypothetical protein
LQFKKLHISLLLIGLISSPLFSRDFTIGEIKNEYQKFLHIRFSKYGERFEVDSLPADHFLSSFVNGNYHYILYILDNCCQNFHAMITDTKDKKLIEKRWQQFLFDDSLFNSIFLNATAYYLQLRGEKIIDYRSKERKKYTLGALLHTGSRFFYPHYLEEYKTFGTHICVGINGLQLSEQNETRDYLFEGFCYAAVFPESRSEESLLMNKYNEIFHFSVMSELPKDIKNKEKELQTIVWTKLQDCQELKDVLLKKYASMKEYLPFSIQGD